MASRNRASAHLGAAHNGLLDPGVCRWRKRWNTERTHMCGALALPLILDITLPVARMYGMMDRS